MRNDLELKNVRNVTNALAFNSLMYVKVYTKLDIAFANQCAQKILK